MYARRIVECVSACEGIKDPAKLVGAARGADALLQAIADGYPDIACDTRVSRTWGALRRALGVS